MTRRAIIAGVGECIQRVTDLSNALEPVDLVASALRAAEADSGARLLDALQSVDVVGLVSWRYQNPVGLLCERLAIAPERTCNASMGGETPVRLIHEAALSIMRGEIRAAAIVGGEASSSRAKARKTNFPLRWTPMPARDQAVQFPGSSYRTGKPARALGMLDPANIYPFYETATQAAWCQTPEQANQQSARLWARYAQVAAANPNAWIKTAPDATVIAEPSADNRLIAWPYPKLMVANPMVDLAAAVIVLDEEFARSLGIADERMVHIWGGAAAAEDEDYLARDRYDHSTAQEAVLEAAARLAGGAERFDRLELYSCFPVVPKMAMRSMGLDPETTVPTVTGGLTFFGGPLNNYMSHAAVAMVRTLRDNPGETGLLYGQGGYLTKHHALVVGTTPPVRHPDMDYSVQAQADNARGAAPPVLEAYEGPATIEAYTVTYARDGEPLQGVVIARTPTNARIMARTVPDDDPVTIAALVARDRSAVGCRGQVRCDVYGKLVFAMGETVPARPRSRTRLEREGRLSIVTIDRPDVLNTFDPATNAEMAEIFDAFEADPEQWVAIVTGAGERAFSAGNDLKATARALARGAPIDVPLSGFGGLTARFDLTKPVIAAVNGLALGGGFEVALACDIIVASDTASFGLPEPKMGLAAVAGGLLRLPAQIGLKRAMGMILTGRTVDAREGLELGFVNEVVPQAELMTAARRWAADILKASPMSIRASKQIVHRAADEAGLAEAYRAQNRYPATRALYRSSDLREGPAAFAEKRKPIWKGQ